MAIWTLPSRLIRSLLTRLSSSLRPCSSSLTVFSSSLVDCSSSFAVSSSSLVLCSSSLLERISSFADCSSSLAASSSWMIDCRYSRLAASSRCSSCAARRPSRPRAGRRRLRRREAALLAVAAPGRRTARGSAAVPPSVSGITSSVDRQPAASPTGRCRPVLAHRRPALARRLQRACAGRRAAPRAPSSAG